MMLQPLQSFTAVPSPYANHGAGISEYIYPIDVPIVWVNMGKYFVHGAYGHNHGETKR